MWIPMLSQINCLSELSNNLLQWNPSFRFYYDNEPHNQSLQTHRVFGTLTISQNWTRLWNHPLWAKKLCLLEHFTCVFGVNSNSFIKDLKKYWWGSSLLKKSFPDASVKLLLRKLPPLIERRTPERGLPLSSVTWRIGIREEFQDDAKILPSSLLSNRAKQ